MIPEKRETNEVNPIIIPAFCLEALSKSRYREQIMSKVLGFGSRYHN